MDLVVEVVEACGIVLLMGMVVVVVMVVQALLF
jgi:hypothetical protein